MCDYNNNINRKQVKETVSTWSQNWLLPATTSVRYGLFFSCPPILLLLFFFNNSYGSIYKTEFEQAPRDGERQGSLACCSPWDRKESDTTEQQQIDLSFCLYCSPLPMCFIFPCGTTASKSVSLMALALCLSCTVYSRLHLLNKAVHRLLQLSFLRS